jgi:hypothetical protein
LPPAVNSTAIKGRQPVYSLWPTTRSSAMVIRRTRSRSWHARCCLV